MRFASRPVALVFRLVTIGLIVTGLVRLIGLFSGGAAWVAFTFYTTLSNVLCLAWMILLVGATIRDMAKDGPKGVALPWPRLGAMVMMAITVTMLIYLVVLVPAVFVQSGGDYQPFTLTDDLIHIVTPCLVTADWFLFAPKGRLRLFEPVLWGIPPYLYLLFAFAWPALGGDFGDGKPYPYPFMDVAALGVGGVAAQILVLTVSLVAFGYIYVLADKLLAWAGRRRAGAGAEAARSEDLEQGRAPGR
jgi:hypothetical protein